MIKHCSSRLYKTTFVDKQLTNLVKETDEQVGETECRVLEESEPLQEEVSPGRQEGESRDCLAIVEVRDCRFLFVRVVLTVDAPVSCDQ